MVHQLLSTNRETEASDLTGQLLAIGPNDPDLLFTAGLVNERRGQFNDARVHYLACVGIEPAHLDANIRLAQMAIRDSDYPDALVIVTAALKREPSSPQLHHLAGQICEHMRHYSKAAYHYERLAELRPQKGAFELLGNALGLTEDHAGARRAYKAALRHGSKPAHIRAILARLEAAAGNFDTAVAHLNTALREDPHDGFAYLQLANDFSSHIDTSELLKAADKAHPPESPAAKDAAMCFATARLHELRHDYDAAFHNYQQANDALDSASDFDPATEMQQATSLVDRYREFNRADINGAGHQSEKPVFVFGLPRTGTTLLEQILSAHPDISGVGEHEAFSWIDRYLREPTAERIAVAADAYLASLPRAAQSAVKVLDKSMSTPQSIGTILTVFPNACFIHCSRHPMETAWSIYSLYFGEKRVPFSNSFEGIAAHFEAHEAIMRFWRERLPDQILAVRYEELVDQPRKVATKALNHIGLEWHPDCEEFHSHDRMVRTASLTQVRQPIYKTASQKWCHYEEHLKPLQILLTPFIERYEAGIIATAQSELNHS